MTSAAKSQREPAIPRPAATVLLLRDNPFEVLMISRHRDQFFSSALVFPGGVVDASDRAHAWLDFVEDAEGLSAEARALRVAGFRETFEETGLFLARDRAGQCVSISAPKGEPFIDIVARSEARLRLSDLTPFGHWITPVGGPKRFDTHFYVCRSPSGQEAVCDGAEAVALEWASPHSILARAAAGENSILFPTRMNVSRLAESASTEQAIAAARARPVFTVLPRAEKRPGGMLVIIPAEAGYSETENFYPHGSRT